MTDQQHPLAGRRCLITGGTGGIGLHAALGLAELGADLILIGRNKDRGERTLAAIRRLGAPGHARFMSADLSLRTNVERIAREVCEHWEALDMLVNNAGGFYFRRETTEEGLERTFALNHLSYFHLTLLLIDRLAAAPAGRIVSVSSGAHWNGSLDFNNLQLARGYSAWRAYSQSKLANLLFTFELARRLEGSQITANAMNPGFVATNLAKDNGWVVRIGASLMYALFARPPETGADTIVYLAGDPQVAGVSGEYFQARNPTRCSRRSRDPELARRLWQVSAELVGVPEDTLATLLQ